MCEHGELIWMPELGPYGRYIDKCMKEVVLMLNETGIKTLGCCCGHGKYPKTIIIKGHHIPNWEWFSGKLINRQRNFYKMDSDGLYYLPEVENE
jgi:hypothetical protein